LRRQVAIDRQHHVLFLPVDGQRVDKDDGQDQRREAGGERPGEDGDKIGGVRAAHATSPPPLLWWRRPSISRIACASSGSQNALSSCTGPRSEAGGARASGLRRCGIGGATTETVAQLLQRQASASPSPVAKDRSIGSASAPRSARVRPAAFAPRSSKRSMAKNSRSGIMLPPSRAAPCRRRQRPLPENACLKPSPRAAVNSRRLVI